MAMIETVRQRQKNSIDFASCYDNLCALQDSCPLGSITANLDELTIDCNADRIRLADWTPILNALKINKTLKIVAFRSFWQQALYPDGGTVYTSVLAIGQRYMYICSYQHTPPPSPHSLGQPPRAFNMLKINTNAVHSQSGEEVPVD